MFESDLGTWSVLDDVHLRTSSRQPEDVKVSLCQALQRLGFQTILFYTFYCPGDLLDRDYPSSKSHVST